MNDLTTLQRIFFWCGFILPIPSVLLYVFLTEGTIKHFGGTPSPTSLFWCSIAAAGDAVISVMCWCVLRNPSNVVLRQSVLMALAVYSVFHLGGFLKAHYMYEPHPSGPIGYIFSIVMSWAAYFAWGRGPTHKAVNDDQSGQPTILTHEKQG